MTYENPLLEKSMTPIEKRFADELRKRWRFDNNQQHTHNYHDREDFIDKVLPKLLGEIAPKLTNLQNTTCSAPQVDPVVLAPPAPEADAARTLEAAWEAVVNIECGSDKSDEFAVGFATAKREACTAIRILRVSAPEADAAGEAELAKLREQRVHLLGELTRIRTAAMAHGAPSLALGMTAGELIARTEAHPAPAGVIDALNSASELRRPTE